MSFRQWIERTSLKESKEVKKLGENKVLFPYSKESSTGEILDFSFFIERQKDKTLISSAKVTDKNKGYLKNSNEIYEIDNSSTDTFVKTLGSALDKYIWEGRPSALEKGKTAYSLLFPENVEKEEALWVVGKKVLEDMRILNLIDSNRYQRNAEDKKLAYREDFTYNNGKRKVSSEVSFLEKDGAVEVTLLLQNMHSPFSPGSRKIWKTFDKPLDKNEIQNWVSDSYTKWIELKGKGTSFLSEEKKTFALPKEWKLINLVEANVDNAVLLFNHYMDQKK